MFFPSGVHIWENIRCICFLVCLVSFTWSSPVPSPSLSFYSTAACCFFFNHTINRYPLQLFLSKVDHVFIWIHRLSKGLLLIGLTVGTNFSGKATMELTNRQPLLLIEEMAAPALCVERENPNCQRRIGTNQILFFTVVKMKENQRRRNFVMK